MAELPPKLHEAIYDVLLAEPRLRIDPAHRDDFLTEALGDDPENEKVDRAGAPRIFIRQAIRELSSSALCRLLQTSAGGVDQQDHVAQLCAELVSVDTALQRATGSTLHAFFRQQLKRLEGQHFVESRFVRLGLLVNRGPQGWQETKTYTELGDLLADLKKENGAAAILLGAPGSGKSTLLRRLAAEHYWQALLEEDGPIPFFVELNAYKAQDGKPPPAPRDWLAQRWAVQTRGTAAPDFHKLLDEGRLLLLLDGLNEIPHSSAEVYGQRVEKWRDLVRDNAAQMQPNQILFSCRSHDYSEVLDSGGARVRRAEVNALDEGQIRSYLRKHLPQQGESVWQDIKDDARLVELFSTPFFLTILADVVQRTGEIPRSRAALLTAFVREGLIRELEKGNGLFKPEANLLSRLDITQVNRGHWPKPFALPANGPLLPALTDLAWKMQQSTDLSEGGEVRVSLRQADAFLELGDPDYFDALLRSGVDLNVLSWNGYADELTYHHQLIQEYFAARRLAQEPQPSLAATPWRAGEIDPPLNEVVEGKEFYEPLPAARQTGWEETMIMAAEMAGGMGTDPATFVTALIPVNLPLAGRCAAAAGIGEETELYRRLQRALLARMRDEAADLRARLAAGEALGDLGHPDYTEGPDDRYLLPMFKDVPGGVYRIGEQKGEYSDEEPEHPVTISLFALAQYPVTNAEFRRFIDDRGYSTSRWWRTAAAKEWLETETAQQDGQEPRPQFWDSPRFNQSLQPVVGVNWYEAQAYCAWLSERTGEIYTLPTEAEWEAAARGRERRTYAYGDRYDPAKGNTVDSGIGRPSPVGLHPESCQTPEGVADLTGNVWEWTSTAFREYEYDPDDGREDPHDAAARRVLRGGSWDSARLDARAAYRARDHPAVRFNDSGFRVVRRPPSHDL